MKNHLHSVFHLLPLSHTEIDNIGLTGLCLLQSQMHERNMPSIDITANCYVNSNTQRVSVKELRVYSLSILPHVLAIQIGGCKTGSAYLGEVLITDCFPVSQMWLFFISFFCEDVSFAQGGSINSVSVEPWVTFT